MEAIRAEGHERSRFTADKAHQFAQLVNTDEIELSLRAAKEADASRTQRSVVELKAAIEETHQIFEASH